MECQSCYELYDETQRIPRNLRCGHTYCEFCLLVLYEHHDIIICPTCRLKHEPNLSPVQLSKNYVAAQLAQTQREILQKFDVCTDHKEPMNIFCQNCKIYICAKCLIQHSGHNFNVVQYSKNPLLKKIQQLQQKGEEKVKLTQSTIDDNNGRIAQYLRKKQAQLDYMDNEFEKLLNIIKTKHIELKDFYEMMFGEHIQTLELENKQSQNVLLATKDQLNSLENIKNKLESESTSVDEPLVKEIQNLEKIVAENLQSSPINFNDQTPQFFFDQSIYNKIESIGYICQSMLNPKIVLFGDKNKILIYDIEKNSWIFKQLQSNKYQFNYFCCAVTIKTGEIILTGGGNSKSAYKIQLDQNFNITSLENMIYCRKEHSLLNIGQYIYALGGYDGQQQTFLNSCEKYDIITNKWTVISSMIIPKCAFASSHVQIDKNSYIYCVGGYDGKDRINVIEKYDVNQDKWYLLDLKLPSLLSNSGCVSLSEDQILILGGGNNSGFIYDLINVDLKKKEVNINKYSKMLTGKDIRNKIIYIKDSIFVMGGNQISTECFNTRKNQWISLKSYGGLVNDNLDSWACALSFDTSIQQKDSLIQSQTLSLNSSQYHNTYEINQNVYLIQEDAQIMNNYSNQYHNFLPQNFYHSNQYFYHENLNELHDDSEENEDEIIGGLL